MHTVQYLDFVGRLLQVLSAYIFHFMSRGLQNYCKILATPLTK